MKRLSAGLSVAAAAALLLTAPPPAGAAAPCVRGESESRSRSSVDDGEIRWTTNTAYADAYKHALKAWQYSGHKIKLAPDSATTVNDVEFVDYNDPKSPRPPSTTRSWPLRSVRSWGWRPSRAPLPRAADPSWRLLGCRRS
ncbi:hypothetical protein ACFY0G_39795 [Streptomyces sp. NPDC001552]|uniref:hypothetical protein n=1 Tax=Streptomyces sp. NPDC001552 TaxID=3364587 RepID=UPI003689ADFF